MVIGRAMRCSGGWTAKEIHQAILTTFDLSSRAYGLNQLRYDLRKLKGHALLQRDGSRYAYHLTKAVGEMQPSAVSHTRSPIEQRPRGGCRRGLVLSWASRTELG
jgi:hypothetical protein